MKTTYLYVGLVVIVILGLIAARQFGGGASASRVTQYDSFAQCISDSGAMFYGAFWCPHCQEQKALFDKSVKLPYVECSTPDGQSQNKVCSDLNITGYPTWTFSDGTRVERTMTREELAEQTSCALPA
jgi:thiol-disulfide isomerase/thioredoxin